MSIVGGSIIFTFTIITLVLIPHDAHAVTRSEIYHLKNNIEDVKNQIASYTENIKRQTDLVSGYEKTIKDMKEAERIAREWDRFTDTEASRNELRNAHSNLINAEKNYNDGNNELQRLINLKNSHVLTLTQLEKKLFDDELLLKQNSKIELQGLTRIIGVELSKTCKTMIINGYNTTCPTYHELVSLDNSRPETGQFGVINGLYQRGQPMLKNDHKLYDFETDFVIVVNPSSNLASRIKMITIENSLDTYFLAYDNIKKDNKRTINHDRYVDSCKNATITSKNWEFLLPDTIHYLRTGCIVTGFDSLEIIEDPKTEIDITTSRHYQYTLWLDGIKQDCKGLCKQY